MDAVTSLLSIMYTCVVLSIFIFECVIVIPLFALPFTVCLKNIAKLVGIFRKRGYETMECQCQKLLSSNLRGLCSLLIGLVFIEPYKNKCLDKHTCFAISLSISKHIFVDIGLYWISSFAYFIGWIKNMFPSISNDWG